jgi:hypothetical protein
MSAYRVILAALLAAASAASPVAAAPLVTMFERDDDVAENELVFRFYDDLDALRTNTPSQPDAVSPIDIAPNFSTTGLTWDGSQFIVMFERDDDVAINELLFRFHDDLDALRTNTLSQPDAASPIDIASSFSTTGLAAIVPGIPPPTGVPLPGSLLLLATGLFAMAATSGAGRTQSGNARKALPGCLREVVPARHH